MTKYFKKSAKFDSLSFMRDFERDFIEESEGDVFSIAGLENAREADMINDAEEGFMTGYLKA